MIGLGTIINAAAIVLGGLSGILFGKFLTDKIRDTLQKVCGVTVLFIGIAGALEGMLSIVNGSIVSGRAILVIVCLALGALIGELLNIEGGIERFGEWLKRKTGNSKDKKFVDGFLTASLTVCIGAMAIIGAIEDGLHSDISILVTKSIIDLITIMVLTCSLGKGCLFSAIPVAVFQGLVTVFALFIQPIMTEAALSNLSLIGSILIFCVGLNLVFGKLVRVANVLPAVVFAVIAAFLPLGL